MGPPPSPPPTRPPLPTRPPPRTETGIQADIITAVAVPWSEHNGALKYFRDCVLTGDIMSKVLTTEERVKRVVHGLCQDYSFGEWGQWDWRTLVAAMSTEDTERLFEGEGIIQVAVERRQGCGARGRAAYGKEPEGCRLWARAAVGRAALLPRNCA